MEVKQRASLEGLAIRYGEPYGIDPTEIRKLNDQKLADLVRSFIIIAEHKRKIAQIAG